MEQQKMPEIMECEAMQCLYNTDGKCHTFGITVGGEEPCCDTFREGSRKGGIASIIGGVGACHVSGCQFNNDFECDAGGIRVSMGAGHPDCGTYKSR